MTSVTAIFCEDIRREATEQDSIVGIFPNNFPVPEVPGLIPKLAIYIRYHIGTEAETPPDSISARLVRPDGEEVQITEIDKNLIHNNWRKSKESNLPYAGFVTRFIMSPCEIKSDGLMSVVVTIDHRDYQCGFLNVVITSPDSTA